MIRTIWLGITFLIVLAAAGSFKFAFGHFGAANASGIVRPEVSRIVAVKTVQQASTNAEPAPDANAPPAAPVVAELTKADRFPMEWLPQTPPAIVVMPEAPVQQLREPAAPAIRHTRAQKPKRKIVKSDVVASKDQAAAEAKPCQLEDFDGLRWAFNLPTGCHT